MSDKQPNPPINENKDLIINEIKKKSEELYNICKNENIDLILSEIDEVLTLELKSTSEGENKNKMYIYIENLMSKKYNNKEIEEKKMKKIKKIFEEIKELKK